MSSKGEPMLYVRLSKTLYGLLQSALLFYKKLRTELEDFGFEVNPYNPCVAYKTVNGSQMNVTWHVNDLKISHKDSLEVTKILDHFGKIYNDQMTVRREKVHDYLGMDLDFSMANTLKIGMIKQETAWGTGTGIPLHYSPTTIFMCAYTTQYLTPYTF